MTNTLTISRAKLEKWYRQMRDLGLERMPEEILEILAAPAVERQDGALGNTFYCQDIEPINMEGLRMSPAPQITLMPGERLVRNGDTYRVLPAEQVAKTFFYVGEIDGYGCLYSEVQYGDAMTLYTLPPAPVAVPRLEMADVVRAHMEIPNCPVMTSNQCYTLAMKLNACLDKVKEMN